MNTTEQRLTETPWQVLADPDLKGRHPYHDHRFITTKGASWEEGYHPGQWTIDNGSIICQMRDTDTACARLIAAAPELLAALEPGKLVAWASHIERFAPGIAADLRDMATMQSAAIAKAKGQA